MVADDCIMSIQADNTEAADTEEEKEDMNNDTFEEDDVMVRYKEWNIMASTNMSLWCSCIKTNANVLLTVDASTYHVVDKLNRFVRHSCMRWLISDTINACPLEVLER